jgi:hypothetical protein
MRVLPRSWQSVNTDFPNYYVSAHLVCDGYATDRIYEWEWFAGQKDRVGVDQPLAAFIPHTPFSALVMTPLCGLSPLHAKRAWTLCNLAMMAGIIVILVSITGLPWRWLTIASFFSIPLYRNLEFGQLYVLLLLLLALAFFAYFRGASATAGALIAIGAALKIFPALLILFFIRKRDARAICGFVATFLISAGICVLIFPHRMLSTYVTEVLPFALRGEANDPFGLNANSLSALLHHLFIAQARSHSFPLVNFPAAEAILLALCSSVILLVAVLTARKRDGRSDDLLALGTLLVAILATSTLPASYHFVLLLLPAALWAEHFCRTQRWPALATLAFLYLLIGWPIWPAIPPYGWRAIFTVPRLWSVLALLGFLCWQLRSRWHSSPKLAMSGLFALLFAVQSVGGVVHLRSIYREPSDPVTNLPGVYSISSLASDNAEISLSVMTPVGWRRAHLSEDKQLDIVSATYDQFAETGHNGDIYYESDAPTPQIRHVAVEGPDHFITTGESPALSPDGLQLAFLRDDHGRKSLWIRDIASQSEVQMTNRTFDVYEFSFNANGEILFSAVVQDKLALYRWRRDAITSLGIADARYPAESPDGRMLSYSHLSHGVWHLAVRDLATAKDRQFDTADCNGMDGAWSRDSTTLYYASDCGNGLWETSLRTRTVGQ